jgi:hypothetical protein
LKLNPLDQGRWSAHDQTEHHEGFQPETSPLSKIDDNGGAIVAPITMWRLVAADPSRDQNHLL